jgi:hypothetical protein
MAAGSQLENGSWALLVIVASRIANDKSVFISLSHIIVIDQWP